MGREVPPGPAVQGASADRLLFLAVRRCRSGCLQARQAISNQRSTADALSWSVLCLAYVGLPTRAACAVRLAPSICFSRLTEQYLTCSRAEQSTSEVSH